MIKDQNTLFHLKTIFFPDLCLSRVRTGTDTTLSFRRFFLLIGLHLWMAFSKVGTATRWLLSPPPYAVAPVEVLIAVELVAIVWSSCAFCPRISSNTCTSSPRISTVLTPLAQEFGDQLKTKHSIQQFKQKMLFYTIFHKQSLFPLLKQKPSHNWQFQKATKQ